MFVSPSIPSVESLTSNAAILECGGLLGIINVDDVTGEELDLIGLVISDKTEAVDPALCTCTQERKTGVSLSLCH